MKETDILKLLHDIKVDNIRQERELFKHVTLLSSAIISIFVFSGNNHIHFLSKIGVGGLFFTILVSVIHLFFIIMFERKETEEIERAVIKIKERKEGAFKTTFMTAVQSGDIKIALLSLKKFFHDEDLPNFLTKVLPLFENHAKPIEECDVFIASEKEKIENSNFKLHWQKYFKVAIVINLVVFCLSLGLIVVDILMTT